MKYKLSEIALFNPTETLKKGTLAKKVGMDKLQPFCRDIPDYEIAEFSGGMKFRNGDTIMARITPCLENGKTAKVNILDTEEVGFGSTEYIVFRAIDGVTDEDYLYYLVCSPIVRDIAIKSMVGSSGRQRVQTDVVKGIEVELPTLDEQRKIGSLLKILDDKIAVNNEINENLEQQISSIYANFFESKSWKPCELGSIIDVKDGTHDSPKPQTSGYLLVTSKHLLPYGVDRITPNRITEKDFKKINERSLVEQGDVLMSMIGTIGLISFVTEREIDYAIKNVALFKTSRTPNLAYYFLTFLKSNKTQQYIEMCLAGSTQKYISLGELRKMLIPVPDSETLECFNEIISPMYQAIILNSQENDAFVAIRDTLLPKLISGELDVSDIDL